MNNLIPLNNKCQCSPNCNKIFTDKQRKFIKYYNGNLTESARKAGYTGAPNTICHTGKRLLQDPHISAMIQLRNENLITSTRESRMAWLQGVYENVECSMGDRLRACEILCRMNADFTDNVQHQGAVLVIDGLEQ